MSGRAFGYGPAWAVGSAGAIAAFPVLQHVERLFIFAENDNGTNEDAILDCRGRWRAAGKHVTAVRPPPGHKDLNDAWLALPSLPLDEASEVFLDICNRIWSGAEIVQEPRQDGVIAAIKAMGLASFGIGEDC